MSLSEFAPIDGPVEWNYHKRQVLLNVLGKYFLEGTCTGSPLSETTLLLTLANVGNVWYFEVGKKKDKSSWEINNG